MGSRDPSGKQACQAVRPGRLVVAFTPSVVRAGLATATFAGGCSWCMQPPLDALEGVVSTTVGYTGSRAKNPTYEEVSAGGTGHAQSEQIVYDPAKIGYERSSTSFGTMWIR